MQDNITLVITLVSNITPTANRILISYINIHPASHPFNIVAPQRVTIFQSLVCPNQNV
jgi:hypothetical protein